MLKYPVLSLPCRSYVIACLGVKIFCLIGISPVLKINFPIAVRTRNLTPTRPLTRPHWFPDVANESTKCQNEIRLKTLASRVGIFRDNHASTYHRIFCHPILCSGSGCRARHLRGNCGTGHTVQDQTVLAAGRHTFQWHYLTCMNHTCFWGRTCTARVWRCSCRYWGRREWLDMWTCHHWHKKPIAASSRLIPTNIEQAKWHLHSALAYTDIFTLYC